jgi:hypothetical protein
MRSTALASSSALPGHYWVVVLGVKVCSLVASLRLTHGVRG